MTAKPASDSSVRPPRLRRSGGFALLVTLTLVAFLVLLLVGLATYTRIETAVAGNQQRQAQARENALVGLQVALGQLQRHAGPDTRVTATGNFTQTARGDAFARHFTGVWDSTAAPGTTPLAWLVSGAERAGATADDVLAAALNPATNATADQEFLLGNRTVSATADRIKVAKQDITAVGVPGQTGAVRIGRYAWWVGDQGVKAPVGLGDATAAVTGGSFDTAEARARIRQQIALGAAPTNFEPRDANNAALVADRRLFASNQLPFLRNASNVQIGIGTVQQNFHHWSPDNQAVLANPALGGLKQDLSIDPTLLGTSFAAWADYGTHMEAPVAAAAATTPPASSPFPDYGADPIRRRHVMTPHAIDGAASHQIAPVLTYFLLTFNVRTVNNSTAANAPLEIRALWTVSLWNPYTAALVPEDLQITVTGLPNNVRIVNDHPDRLGQVVGTFSPSATFGSPLTLSLPWPSAPVPATAVLEDRASWLPGRVHSWRSIEDKSGNGAPAAGYDSFFGARDFNSSGDGVVFPLAGIRVADGGDSVHLDVSGSENLVIAVNALRSGGPVRLGRFQSVNFVSDFSTVSQPASRDGKQFTYVFRLAEGVDTPAAPGTWMLTDGRDVRRRTVPPEAYLPEAGGDNPAAYDEANLPTVVNTDRLLDRSPGSLTYNEDAPVFELPRAPLLSIGALQHLRMIGRRHFMIGNSWGVAETLNGVPLGELFDRFFFTGLASGVTPATNAAGEVVALPNPLLRPQRLATGDRPTEADLRALPEARTSARLLQSAAFNLNSTSSAAWAAVLRSVRFPTQPATAAHGGAFRYLRPAEGTGTADDGTFDDLQSGDAQFFRFSQTAQETYKAEAGFAAGSAATPSSAATHLFRQGMKSLTAAQVTALADAIAAAIKLRQETSGPFRSVAEFIAPAAAGAPSLLEQAILTADDPSGANAMINRDAAGNPLEFSSQYLTQADIMTALAPVLFARSDTFVIRAYGESLNPVTASIEGRAWCEATVQRLPDYMEATVDAPEVAPAALTSQINQQLGRRFKVVSFRWLTRADL